MIKELIAKIFNIKIKSDCPSGACYYDDETGIYKIRGKKYCTDFFNILGTEDYHDYIFRVELKDSGVYTIKKLPLN